MKGRPGVATEVGKRRRRGLDRATISAGVGDEQDEHVDPAVALLAMQPALQRLQVVEDRLRFNSDPQPLALDEQDPTPRRSPRAGSGDFRPAPLRLA